MAPERRWQKFDQVAGDKANLAQLRGRQISSATM